MTSVRPSAVVLDRCWPDDEVVASGLNHIVAALGADVDALVGALLSGIQRDVPMYAALDSEGLEVVAEGVRQAAMTFVAVLTDRRRLSRPEIDSLVAIGRVRRAQGIPPEEIRAAARAAVRSGWAYMLDLAVTLPNAAAPAPLGRLGADAFDFADQAVAALLRGAQEYELDGPSAETIVRRELADKVLMGGFGDDEAATARARALGIDLTQPFVVLQVARASADGETIGPLHRRLEKIAAEVPVLFNGMLRSEPILHGVIVVEAVGAEDALNRAEENAGEDGVIVLASPAVVGARAIQDAYERGQGSLAVARLARSPPGVVEASTLAAHRLLSLSKPSISREFVEELLGPVLELPPGRRARLLEALEAKLWADSYQDAGDRIGRHGKTVAARLRELGRISGLDPNQVDDLFVLHLALVLHQVNGSPEDWGS
jgi:hypothetical protein